MKKLLSVLTLVSLFAFTGSSTLIERVVVVEFVNIKVDNTGDGFLNGSVGEWYYSISVGAQKIISTNSDQTTDVSPGSIIQLNQNVEITLADQSKSFTIDVRACDDDDTSGDDCGSGEKLHPANLNWSKGDNSLPIKGGATGILSYRVYTFDPGVTLETAKTSGTPQIQSKNISKIRIN